MPDTLVTEAATADATASTATAEATASTATAEATKATEATEATEAATAEATKTAAEPAKPAGAPETYEAFKTPEGQTYTEGMLSAFAEAAKAANLPQDAAQGLLDKIAPAYAKLTEDRIAQAREDWATQSKNDKEFGGDKLPENLAYAQKALAEFGSPELKSLLNESGLGNHPEVIRLLVKAGRAISEDRVVSGKSETPAQATAQKLYSASKMNP